jgi:hypothetical protein
VEIKDEGFELTRLFAYADGLLTLFVLAANLSKRGDVVLYANISGDGTTAETTLVVLRFGSPSVAVCDDKDLDRLVAQVAPAPGTLSEVRGSESDRSRPQNMEGHVIS